MKSDFVPFHRVRIEEQFITRIATVSLIASVLSLVIVQMSLMQITSIAKVTHKLFFLSFLRIVKNLVMILQRKFGLKFLSTQIAMIVSDIAVFYHMSLQIKVQQESKKNKISLNCYFLN